jgi:hypothetical protein
MRASLGFNISVNSMESISSGQITNLISSCTHPKFRTPPPKNLLKEVYCEISVKNNGGTTFLQSCRVLFSYKIIFTFYIRYAITHNIPRKIKI